MRIQACPLPAPGKAAGFTLLEILIATLLLAACLVPAANALRDAMGARATSAGEARNLDCVGTLMETVLATPYDRLLALATSGAASAYPVPDDTACPPRRVTITRYGNDSNRKLGPGTSAYLLYVRVELANAADGHPYPLTTLVAR